MKRHDVSNPGPDTRYPEHERNVILWRANKDWRVGHYDAIHKHFTDRHFWPIEDVVAWSDPTEPESAEPVAWMRISSITGKATGVFLSDDVELRSEKLVPLYAIPPDHTALLRQAVKALSDLTEFEGARAALAALRGALPQPKESHEQNQI